MRGAFTGAVADRKGVFEQADGGTVFLDEIGDTAAGAAGASCCACSKTARCGRSAASARGERRRAGHRRHQLRSRARRSPSGAFREDLFYRLSVIAIRVPPLRERRADIPLLIAQLPRQMPARRAGQQDRRCHPRRWTR